MEERYHATTQNRFYPDMSREIPYDYTEPVLSRYVYRDTMRLYRTGFYPDKSREIPYDYTEPVLSRYV